MRIAQQHILASLATKWQQKGIVLKCSSEQVWACPLLATSEGAGTLGCMVSPVQWDQSWTSLNMSGQRVLCAVRSNTLLVMVTFNVTTPATPWTDRQTHDWKHYLPVKCNGDMWLRKLQVLSVRKWHFLDIQTNWLLQMWESSDLLDFDTFHWSLINFIDTFNYNSITSWLRNS